MIENRSREFQRLLATLRWIAVAGQTVTILLVTGPMHVALPLAPLWSGVAALVVFNIYVSWRGRRRGSASAAELFGQLAGDVAVLAWLVGWSGGIENPFASLFLLPIALAIFALPQRWIWAVAACSTAGYGLSGLLGHPLPHVHGALGDTFDLHKLGMLVNFVVSAAVMLVFFARIAAAWRARELELATLRERFARNEGIVALATHAASVAHELNTPLATLTLLVEEIGERVQDEALRRDVATADQLLAQCRDRVRALASPAHAADGTAQVDLESVIDRWQLIRPTIELVRSGSFQGCSAVDASVGHLLLALLNNAADAGEQAGIPRVDLQLEADARQLSGRVRDYGAGFDEVAPKLPGVLFRTNKPGGLGIGLALSHATVERLGGSLSMQGAEGRGVTVSFQLPVAP